jgi:hypothetical protein
MNIHIISHRLRTPDVSDLSKSSFDQGESVEDRSMHGLSDKLSDTSIQFRNSQ